MGDEERKGEDKKRKRQGTPEPIDIPRNNDNDDDPHTSLPPWVAGGSPAKFITHDEMIKMSTEFENMELVHEIAIDPNFSIPEKPQNPIEASVKETIHRAFYDNLRQDLAKDPPEYEFCFGFLMDIKKIINEDILTAQHVRLRAEVNAALDESSLRNKLEQDALDVKDTMKYVINLCSRLCAPERDSLIAALRSRTDLIEIFQGTMDLLELMKNDLANYQISQNRAAIEEYSAKHEYEMYRKFLTENPNGADLTKKWLSNAYDELFEKKQDEQGTSAKKEKIEEVKGSDGIVVDTTSRAYVKLVHSENPNLFPETFKIDKSKISTLAEKFAQIVICASSVFITCNVAGKQISESANFKKTLKDHLIAISNLVDEKTLKTDLEKMGEQCVKESKECAEKLKEEWSDDKSAMIRNQINALVNLNHPIRELVKTRVSTFVEEMLRRPTTVPHRLLPGLSVIQSELCAFTSRYLRLCVHNRNTFIDLYTNIINEFQSVPIESSSTEPSTSGAK